MLLRYRAVLASAHLAMAISSSRESIGMRPICIRYMRIGSSVMLPDPVVRFRGVFLAPPGCDVSLDSDAVGSVLSGEGDGMVCRVREEVGATGDLQGQREMGGY